MFKNYFKVALRNMKKYKTYSVINILGLSVGIACTILLTLFVQKELSYDDYHENADRIYRVAGSHRMAGQNYELAVTPAPLAKTLIEEFPEVENAVRFKKDGGDVVKYNNNVFKESNLIHADNSFFDIFTIPLIIGDKKEVLKKPNTVAISEKLVKKYFGQKNPIGEIIRVGDQRNYEVTGIYKSIPTNTHFKFDFIMSMETLTKAKNNNWINNNYNTYIVINKNSSVEQVEAKFPSLMVKYLLPSLEKAWGTTRQEIEKMGGKAEYYLQPVADIHLYSDLDGELGTNSDIKYIYLFLIIALFILVIAGINFINISTARSATRAKEVGIRKVLGSDRKELVKQFLSESFLTTLVSLIISIAIVEMLLPFFNELTGQQLTLNYFENLQLIFLFTGILIFMGLLAGSYPAFILSAFNPVNALSGSTSKKAKTGFFRSGLVVFQFASSIILVIATMVVYNQLDYIQNKKLGFGKDHVIILEDAYLLGNQIETFKNEITKLRNVESASISGFLPVPSAQNINSAFPEGKPDQVVAINQWNVDQNYLQTMKIEIAEGRNFSKQFGGEKENIVINEAVVKLFGIENPIGKRLCVPINNRGEFRTLTIIGVSKNFHFESLRNNIEPLMLFIGGNTDLISFRTTGENIAGIIDQLETKWKYFVPNQPFNYSFLDEKFNKMYSAEQKTGKVFGIFAGLAIFIGCLGLFSLSAFTAEQKTKEIGIRKVLGSSIFGIVYLLSGEFLKLVFIAFAIAVPIAYYFMNQWLMDFAYRTNLSFGIFLSAGFIALFITILTVGWQAIKAALANPVDSLRSE